MVPTSRNTKLKIISGYTLLFILSIFAVIFIYRQIIRLSANEEKISNTSQKFFIIGNTLTGLYEAESLSNAFLQTGSTRTFNRFIDRMEKVEDNIDSLRNLTTREEQKIRLDSINLLLDQKMSNLNALIHAKQSLKPDDFYQQAISRIETTRDSLESQQEPWEKVIITRDTTYVKTEKKRRNFWSWLTKPKTDSTLQITISQHTVTDTLPHLNQLQNPDTVVHLLQSVWNDLQEKNKNIKQEISRTEYNIIRQSTRITDQLRRILGDYEKEELTNSFQKIENREKIIQTSTRTVAGIAIAALILMLLFSFFILRDISRSQQYRRQLEDANLYAGQLLKSREKLILTITHDIKSPLSSIIGYTELLENTPVDERQRYFLKNMQGSSRHILRLVTDLLDYSKLENHKMPLEKVVYNPQQLFRETCESFLPQATAKKLNLIYTIGEELDHNYYGDALRIRQIITNILSNAVKYTAQGSICFSATAEDNGNQMLIRIEDTGTGMTPEEQKTIFEEFTRLKSHSHIEGTGLGLTITLKLIDLLEGRLELESEPGKGSCFTLFLPLQAAPEITSLPAPETKSIPAATTDFSSLRVLLVDDDPLQLAMTSGMLENKGVYTETTIHPEEVAEKLRRNTYDLLISDIQMPGLSGFGLVKQIRQLPEGAGGKIPVIALSADAGKTEKEYREAGFTAYLSKPFTSAQLLEVITRLTGTAPAGSPLTDDPELQPGPEETFPEGYTLKNIRLFTDNDPSALKAIIRSFCTTTHEHLGLLEKLLQQKETEEIARLAHKMLPMFRQLETGPQIRLLEKLEQMRHTPLSPEEIAGTIRQILDSTKKLLEKMEKFLSNDKR